MHKHDKSDDQLPEAHTCFFQLDLPAYSKDKACKEKLLYAIRACGEIDGDAWSGAVIHEEDEGGDDYY